ncbi:beta-ketoacyl synthase N-terminal-like domain-containing protein [Pseudoalteromonas sp. MMG022]|uniref:beta-ketoacyl synthase N-terminal-like domain-containing protein n=1 Tax=Pseudoalteromonas sp. MMG022 TaxID=2909978 RepID=UPI001F25B5C1|nr:beta-ketoacyl synthase N-terminal-like domain-containing protein [Pseudoalteromonas sp. MMG022]MCF6436500.1 hypothetical protein [Pseudoalteromonas sp. MMG022]
MSDNKVYVAFANVLTCLGDGLALQERLFKGMCGFSPASTCFPESFPDENTPIGVIKDISESEYRIPSILKKMSATGVIPSWIGQCDHIFSASSLGDLKGKNAGRPINDIEAHLSQIGCEKNVDLLVSSACSSGTDVLGQAYAMVKSGAANIIAVLAVDCLDPAKLRQHLALGTQSPEGAMPLDTKRNGTTFGEGGACVVVANSRGLSQIGETSDITIRGFGMSCDASDITAPAEHGQFLAKAISKATASVGTPDFINLHGSGTPLSDAAEAAALTLVFAERAHDIPVNGTKGAVGHLLGAAGLAEAVISIWALKNQMLLGTVGHSELDPLIPLNVIGAGASTETTLRSGLSITCGFGGVNSCIAFERE